MATQVFKIPDSFKKDAKYTFCPGCDHGIAVRLVGECLDELGIRENTIAACAIGCSVTIYDFLNIDALEAPHGRAMAEATGIKRARPDKFVFTYQGDGDFASIGLAESIHAALRGEKISAICINNTTYGMTGGQLGPTTVLGQVTTTSPTGGLGLGFVEILSTCPTNWKMSPQKAHERVREEMMPVFKPGIYKDITEN